MNVQKYKPAGHVLLWEKLKLNLPFGIFSKPRPTYMLTNSSDIHKCTSSQFRPIACTTGQLTSFFQIVRRVW